MDQSEAQFYAGLFSQLMNNDNDIRNAADQKIQMQMIQNPKHFTNICVEILKNCNDVSIRVLSGIAINRMLELQSPEDLKIKRNVFTQEYAQPIVSIVCQLLNSPEEPLRNTLSKTYALLFAILKENMPGGIQSVVQAIFDDNNLPNSTIGYIHILIEIMFQKNFQAELAPQFKDYFLQVFVYLLQHIVSADFTNIPQSSDLKMKLSSSVRFASVRYLNELLLNYPSIILQEDETNENEINQAISKINFILSCLPASLRYPDENLFDHIIQLLFILVKQYYRISRGFVETVFDYVYNGLTMKNIGNMEQTAFEKMQNSSIYFWKELGSLEYNLQQKNVIAQQINAIKTNSKYPQISIYGLTQIAAPKVVPQLIRFMEQINPQDIDVEDVEAKPEPSMYATVSLAGLYQSCPSMIFNLVQPEIEREVNQSLWTNYHSALLLIYSIADEPTDNCICELIAKYWGFLIKSSDQLQPPRLRETALFVIGLAIKNYPQLISNGNLLDISPEERINQILSLMSYVLDVNSQQSISYNDTQIFIRFANILYTLTEVWNDNRYEQKIGIFFNQILSIITHLINIGINNAKPYLIQCANEAKNNLLYYTNQDENIRENYIAIFNDTMTKLMNSFNLFASEDIRFVVQASLCSNISILSLIFSRNEKLKDFLHQISHSAIQVLITLLKMPNVSVYEEGLVAIASIISCDREAISNEELNQILVFIQTSFISENANVINAGCILLGDIFQYLAQKYPHLKDNIPYIFDSLNSLILNHPDMRDIHQFVLKAISDIFLYGNSDEIRANSELEDKLLTLLRAIVNQVNTLDLSSKNDTEYGNYFYENLSSVYRSYAITYYDNSNLAKEKEQLLLLDKLSQNILKLAPKINERVLLSFAKAAEAFATNCTRRNNVILNRFSNHKLLELGAKFNKKVSDELKKTSNLLKSK